MDDDDAVSGFVGLLLKLLHMDVVAAKSWVSVKE